MSAGSAAPTSPALASSPAPSSGTAWQNFLGGRQPDDLLNPLLIKEARQSLRSWMFVVQTCALQGVLVVATAYDMAAGRSGGNFFWTLLGLTVLLVIPLTTGTLLREAKARNLELVSLTGLSSWRIIMGKWLGASSQCLLVVFSVLPYLVLRYFNLGTDLLNELQTLFAITALSLLSSAAFLCLFALPNLFFRGVALALAIAGFSVMGSRTLTVAFSSVTMPSSTTAPIPWSPIFDYVGLFLLFGIVLAYLLTLAATSISGPAENLTTRLRWYVAAVTLATSALSLVFGNSEAAPIVMVMAALAMLLAVLEPTPALFSGYLPFTRGGLLGRLGGAFFSPGWPSGICFVLLMGVLISPQIFALLSDVWKGEMPYDVLMRTALATFATLNLLLVPLAFMRLMNPRMAHPIGPFVIIQVCLWSVAFMGLALCEILIAQAKFSRTGSSSMLELFRVLLGLLPPYGFLQVMLSRTETSAYISVWALLSLFVLGLTLLALWWRAHGGAAARRELFDQAAAFRAAPPPHSFLPKER